ncbi:MAG: GYD domain-containing protein, partial [Phycisphaerae bacterium]|nr:GYD domain-containing protein [Phycisphaerae bacterium]NIW96214.1 GYD domain-containing protein [Phycisphaerae bacterium]NIX32103.1 GYD domain-containing protein [Phycisphaerae bacterium]
MSKYMIHGNYVGEGIKGLLKEGGSSRRSTIETLIKGMGGTMEAFYYTFGDDDVFVIFEAPDNVSVAAISLVVNASGLVSAKTTVLLTPEEIDEATKKTVAYRP